MSDKHYYNLNELGGILNELVILKHISGSKYNFTIADNGGSVEFTFRSPKDASFGVNIIVNKPEKVAPIQRNFGDIETKVEIKYIFGYSTNSTKYIISHMSKRENVQFWCNTEPLHFERMVYDEYVDYQLLYQIYYSGITVPETFESFIQ